jgi:hypothetical protein
MLRARTRMLEIAERRARYVERARAEREALAQVLAKTDGAASVLAGVRRVLDGIRQRPLIIVAVVALLVALRPRRSLKWMARGWWLWRLYRQVRGWRQHLEAATGVQPARRPG